MAGATLNLSAIQALIALGGYGGRGNNAPSSAVLGLSAALFLSNLSIWQGAGDTLTSDEIDDIEELIAQLEYDLMVTGDMYPIDKVRVTNSVGQAIPHATETILQFDIDVYDPEDMHSIVTNNERIYAVREGLHILSFNVLWQAASIGQRGVVLMRHRPSIPSTVMLTKSNFPDVSGTTTISHNVTFQDDALEGDYYYVRVYQDSGGPIDVIVFNSMPTFAVVRV